MNYCCEIRSKGNAGRIYLTMHIGILQCDHVWSQHRPIAGEYADMFIDLFADHCPELTFEVYDVIDGQYPASFEECDGYLLTGSKHGAYEDEPWIHQLKDYVRELHAAGGKTVGICFGHQLLAEALGGKVVKSEKGWGVGVHEVQVFEKKPWMEPQLDAYFLNVCHQDQVVALPPGAQCLAGNDHCPNALFALDERCLGMQAHPEIRTPYLEAVMAQRVSDMGAAVVERAKESLACDVRPYVKVAAHWISHFFNSR